MKNIKFTAICYIIIFVLPLTFCSYISNLSDIKFVHQNQLSYYPIVAVDLSEDRNQNKIHDHLDSMMSTNKGELFEIIMSFNQSINEELVGRIEALGGNVLSTWSLVYGAAVEICVDNINSLAQLVEVTFITENFKTQRLLSTSVPQINVRPYVWDTLGYEGDPNHAIAILDTGIDSNHPDLVGRVTCWHDFIGANISVSGDEYAIETDNNGHGTHCASIIAGSGMAAGTSNTINVSGTMGIPSLLQNGSGYITHVEIESTGTVTIEVSWEERPGPSSNDETILIVLDTNSDGIFNSEDDYITDDYQNQPISLTSSISLSPGKYAILIGAGEANEIDRAAVRYVINRPTSSISDGHNKYRGVAPYCKLVALKVLDDEGFGSSTQLLDALDWIYNNGLSYNIQIVSMSLGLDTVSAVVDSAVNNLVSAGYICVVAAGNDFMVGNPIYSPGTASKAITVGAIDDVDKIAVYSSNGLSDSGKPDVVAPGGAYRYLEITDENTHPIIAADSNNADYVIISSDSPNGYWESELNNDDYVAYQGTSMATAHVAGLCALIIQAMGDDWNHAENNVLRVKNYICGTATEVGEGERYSTYYNTPLSDRGDADQVEGFGKVHGDAAIEAILTTYIAGSTVIDSLSDSPTGKQSWARKVDLEEGIVFEAGMAMDDTADYDLYIYDPSIDMSIYLGYLTSSTNIGMGLSENIIYTPSSSMPIYLVVKRVSGYGSFTLQAKVTEGGSVTPPPFTFPISIPMLIWAIVGFVGLSSIVYNIKKRNVEDSLNY